MIIEKEIEEKLTLLTQLRDAGKKYNPLNVRGSARDQITFYNGWICALKWVLGEKWQPKRMKVIE